MPLKASSLLEPSIAKEILRTAGKFPLSTRESLINFLNGEFLSSDLEEGIDRLQEAGYLILEPKASGSGTKIFAFTLTREGMKFLSELNG